jgi:CelD/BcsL family acetyltransferase involved in cellulose biosynthesis
MNDGIAVDVATAQLAAPGGEQTPRAAVIRAISPVRAQWAELQRCAAPNVFQSLGWCQAWQEAAESVGQAEALFLVGVWVGTRLEMLWPLAITHSRLGRVLHALAEPATQYCDALLAPDADRAALLRCAWGAIAGSREVDVVELRRVRADAAIAALPLIASGAVAAHCKTSAPAIAFEGGGAPLRRSGRTYNVLRKHERMLSRHGPVEFALIADPDAKAALVDEAIRLKHGWMRERGLWSAGYSHPANAAFQRALARRPEFLVARLTSGGVTAAIEAGIVDRGHYWSLLQGYDARFAEHGPGRLLTWRLVDWCPQGGIGYFDFLAPAHAHKREWANREVPVGDYVIPLTLRGRIAAFSMLYGRPLAKRMFQTLPLNIRHRVVGAARRLPKPHSAALHERIVEEGGPFDAQLPDAPTVIPPQT